MRLGTRIFICYMLIFASCFYYPINWILDNLRIRYLEGIEDPLVDQANLLAGIVGHQMENERFDPENLYAAIRGVYSRALAARIYQLVKTRVDMHFYITDASGKLIFNSENMEYIGADFSNWRDVRLTLDGEYGARTSLKDPKIKTSSVLYVAAPILVYGDIAGVLTMAKPTTNINSFLGGAKPQIARLGLFSMLATMLLSLFASIWITRPIKRLTRYADDIRAGKRVEFPKLDSSEIGKMGHAFEKMQEALEGKKYIEQYVQTLTHEIKSPLSAIRGAAELLEEKMDFERRARFLFNIRNEANRIQDIVDRMLELAELETLKILERVETISFHTVIKTVLESKQPLLLKKKLSVNTHISHDILMKGDSFLLNQAVGNLIQNAIDFSLEHGRIELAARIEDSTITFTVADEGPGIPEYAQKKIFNKFFSMQRPDSGKKSTGLGLNFVREVVELHGGEVRLESRKDKGVRATLILPV